MTLHAFFLFLSWFSGQLCYASEPVGTGFGRVAHTFYEGGCINAYDYAGQVAGGLWGYVAPAFGGAVS